MWKFLPVAHTSAGKSIWSNWIVSCFILNDQWAYIKLVGEMFHRRKGIWDESLLISPLKPASKSRRARYARYIHECRWCEGHNLTINLISYVVLFQWNAFHSIVYSCSQFSVTMNARYSWTGSVPLWSSRCSLLLIKIETVGEILLFSILVHRFLF